MAIKMQGLWLVKIKSKSAAFPQQFQISGAASGNGTYGHAHAGEVLVTGTNWTINVRHNPGGGFRSSQVKLIPPTVSGGFYRFDIQTNDSGGDQDFNDFILTCRTPVTSSDYLIYGTVQDYAGRCLLNPCNRYWVLDTFEKLQTALTIPKLKDYLQQVFPNRVKAALRFNPTATAGFDPQPEPPDFIPMVIPRPGDSASPLKQKFLVKTEEKQLDLGKRKTTRKASAKAAPDIESLAYSAITSSKALLANDALLNPAAQKLRQQLEHSINKIGWFCDKDPLANTRVKFYEYDRTPAELAGGAYTGTGSREYLGDTFTDDFGNYIFRFSRSLSDIVDEISTDTGITENAQVQARPDIVAEVMQPLDPYQTACATAPFWNIPQFRRINICIPRSKVGLRPLACDGQHILQGIGNVVLGTPNVDGSRTGFNNVLTKTGIITVNNSLAEKIDCGAWHGNLILRGCLDNPRIKYYTLETRRPGGTWTNLDISFTLPRFFGSFQLNWQINAGEQGGKTIYLNAETDSGDWLKAFLNIKARFSTTHSNFSNGTNYIRITGLDKNKNPIAGIQEELPIYIMNNRIQLDIDNEVEMVGGGTISDCGLFILPADELAPINVRFKATQGNVPPVFAGFMSAYSFRMQKGSSSYFALTNQMQDHTEVFDNTNSLGKKYVPAGGGGLNCDLTFFGTATEPGEEEGYIQVRLNPANPWLNPGQQFCTFALDLYGRLRRTNGQTIERNTRAIPVLFGIQRPDAATGTGEDA